MILLGDTACQAELLALYPGSRLSKAVSTVLPAEYPMAVSILVSVFIRVSVDVETCRVNLIPGCEESVSFSLEYAKHS